MPQAEYEFNLEYNASNTGLGHHPPLRPIDLLKQPRLCGVPFAVDGSGSNFHNHRTRSGPAVIAFAGPPVL
jgi:hypothetical protein